MCEPRIRYLLIASEDHSCTIAARSANTGERGRSAGVVTLKNVRRVSGLTNTRSPHSRDELVVCERFKGHREQSPACERDGRTRGAPIPDGVEVAASRGMSVSFRR
jgi:hypothetical protein